MRPPKMGGFEGYTQQGDLGIWDMSQGCSVFLTSSLA
jgi:hypothetical protein